MSQWVSYRVVPNLQELFCSEHFLLRAMLAKVQQVDQDAHTNGVDVLRGFCLSHASPVGFITLSEGLSCLVLLKNPGYWCW